MIVFYKTITCLCLTAIILSLPTNATKAVCTEQEHVDTVACMEALNLTVGIHDVKTMCSGIYRWGQCVPKCACEDDFVMWVSENLYQSSSVYACESSHKIEVCSVANVATPTFLWSILLTLTASYIGMLL